MNQEKIGQFIANCRKDKKITQEELGSLLGVSNKTVSRWENGYYLPDIALFNDLCTILDIELVDLINGEKIQKDFVSNEVEDTLMDLVKKLVDASKYELKQKKHTIIRNFKYATFLILTLFFISFYALHSTPELALRTKIFMIDPDVALHAKIQKDTLKYNMDKESLDLENAKVYSLSEAATSKYSDYLKTWKVMKKGFLYYAVYKGEA